MPTAVVSPMSTKAIKIAMTNMEGPLSGTNAPKVLQVAPIVKKSRRCLLDYWADCRCGEQYCVALKQLFLDRRDHTGVARLGLGRKHRREVAVAPDQIFVKVPTRGLARTL